MSRWFRLYDELIDDPKFIKLGPDLRSALIMLWCIASKNNGRLSSLEDVSIKLRLSESRTKKLLDELELCKWLDRDNNGLFPHNWNGRQYQSDSAAERMKRYRNRRNALRNMQRNSDGIEQNRTETDTDTEQRQKEDTANAVSSSDGYAFESGVIRLREGDFRKWERSFSLLDLRAELLSLTEWAASQPKWFFAVAGALAKRNRELGLKLKIEKEKPNAPSKSAAVAAGKLAEAAERGEFSFGPRPSLLPQKGAAVVRLLPEGRSERPADVQRGDSGDICGLPPSDNRASG